jgi:hypothetical protein
MIAFCTGKQRRNLLLQQPGTNGLDYLEVLGPPGCGDQLALTFLKDARGLMLTTENISLTGDTPLAVTNILPASNDDPLTVTIQLNGSGDFSPYTLTLVQSSTNNDPPAGIDAQLNTASFSFKAGCATPVDCKTVQCCPSDLPAPPDIHYLARDFASLRQAMLDRIAALVPTWTETHESDLGITLVEALAYAADRVSYRQDAVNTEAYIGTARSRISLRRHARLVDYQVSEGANSRAWICLTTSNTLNVPAGTQFYPLVPGLQASIDPLLDAYQASLLAASPGPVFESMEDVTIYAEQNQMGFYSWGDDGCCLPVGATQATLNNRFETLAAGQVLIFVEARGPLTGDPADADPTHRWAVRLTYASIYDESGNWLVDPVNPAAQLTNIAWNSADALPFSLCISSVTSAGLPQSGVSVALGNVVPTDHGTWTENESLGAVPPAPGAPVAGSGCNCSSVSGAAAGNPRFQPVLANQPLTFAVPYDTTASPLLLPSASSFLSPDSSTAAPQITLTSDDGNSWTPMEDLLGQDGDSNAFIPEIEWDGSAHLRFGDGTYGAAPVAGVDFTATYRTGNGTAGNVGRDTLAHCLISGAGITGVRNPLAAAGGVDPETMQHIAQVAPFTFQSQLRCVSAADYGTMAATLPGVAEAQGTLRWTGSWYSAFVSIDPTDAWNTTLAAQVESTLDMYRMMGTDLVVEQAVFVGINIGLEICVAPSFFQADVYAAVWKLLVTGDSCAGTTGLLNAANFQFGQTVYASPIIAAAQTVVGVAAVTLVTFERMSSSATANSTPATQLTMGAVEIPRCDNDPNHADRGLLVLTMEGGK